MTDNLLQTPLYNLHVALGAKMVPFAGYSMPVQYPLGVLKEHLHTREKAGLFDVSHMGQLRLRGDNVAEELEKLIPIDIQGLAVGQQRYGVLTNEAGGLLDDLMVTRMDDHFYLVVNAGCKLDDIAHLRAHLPTSISIEVLDDALLALQGPAAREVMARFAPELKTLAFMQTLTLPLAGITCQVSCSGYTGEDGYEISVAASDAVRLVQLLLTEPEVEMIGLGARDSLRLEAGLCLYGHDIDQSTSIVEADLLWAVSKVRRPDGERAGGYPGAQRLQDELSGKPSRRRVMLKPDGKAPVREGAQLVNSSGDVVGHITSGGFGPCVGAPVAMGYVSQVMLDSGETVFALLRGKSIPCAVSRGSFLPSRYFRG
jgi:aminomethyltransferase